MLLTFVLLLALAVSSHILGHIIALRKYKEIPVFYINWIKLFNTIPFAFLAWKMPAQFTNKQKLIVALAGFVFEFLFGILLLFVYYEIGYLYIIMFVIHIILYVIFYKNVKNDFMYIKNIL